jgi:hypothetical protein
MTLGIETIEGRVIAVKQAGKDPISEKPSVTRFYPVK